MLNLSTTYEAQSSAKNIVSDWLLELSYDSGTFYFSGQDRTISSNLYHGNVTEWGNIDESIDLAKSSSSIADIQIEVANKWANESGLLSAEVFGGAKKFINQDVIIRSWIPGCTTTADCLTIYKGRLVDIKHNLETVTFSIEKRSPWDRVKFPIDKSTEQRLLTPVAYGEFSGTNTSTTTEAFVSSKSLCPIPLNDINGGKAFYNLYGVGISGVSRIYYYEESLNKFIRLDDESHGDHDGSTMQRTDIDYLRGFKFYPFEATENNDFLDPLEAVDGDTTITYANQNLSVSETGLDPAPEQTKLLDLQMPNITGYYTKITVTCKYWITLSAGVGDNYGVRIRENSLGGDNLIDERVLIDGIGTNTGTITKTITSEYSGDAPPSIQIYGYIFANKAGDPVTASASGSVRVYDLYVTINTKDEKTDEPLASSDAVQDMCYGDSFGYEQGFTGGGGQASYPHDIDRDLLARFAGWDATGIDYVEVNGTDWSASTIDTDRNWASRWWTLKQIPLLQAHAQAQFEGGFIWVFDETATGREARIIYVQSSYSSSDFTIDGNDIKNIDISTTPFSEIVTKRTFSFQRHPADEKRYLQTDSLENANRADYNLDAEENAIEQDLDFLTDLTDVGDLLSYYDNISGEPKLLVKCDLLKPSDWAMQVGDIVKFDNMAYEPYGNTWASVYFMCIRTNISPNKFTVTFREVG